MQSRTLYSFSHLQKIDRERDEQERQDPRFKGRLITVQELPGWLIKDEDEVQCTLIPMCIHLCIVSKIYTYRIACNFEGYYFRGQTDLHEIFPHENVGVAYWNTCNAKCLLTKITVFELNEFFTPRKLPATCIIMV